MGALEPWHLVVILVIALIVFGPGKVADIGGTLGKGVKDFREAMDGKTPATPAEPAAPAISAPAPTVAPRQCPRCGSTIAADAKFCAQCGATVTTTPATDTRAN